MFLMFKNDNKIRVRGDKCGPLISSVSLHRFISQTPACSLKDPPLSHTKPTFNAPHILTLHITETNLNLDIHSNLEPYSCSAFYLNMASLPLLLLLILCGSLHACTPRPLTEKDTTKYHFNKVGFRSFYPFSSHYKLQIAYSFVIFNDRKTSVGVKNKKYKCYTD